MRMSDWSSDVCSSDLPFLVGDEGIRMSLAGAQPKLPVILVAGAPALPSPGQPTTHIVKPGMSRFAHSVETEAFAMRLAAAAGLAVAAVEPRRAPATPYFLVERYHRRDEEIARATCRASDCHSI